MKKLIKITTFRVSHIFDLIKNTGVNRASLHGGSLEITLTVHLRCSRKNNFPLEGVRENSKSAEELQIQKARQVIRFEEN